MVTLQGRSVLPCPHTKTLLLEAMHEPICEREQLFGANIYTQLVHMILLIGTTGI